MALAAMFASLSSGLAAPRCPHPPPHAPVAVLLAPSVDVGPRPARRVRKVAACAPVPELRRWLLSGEILRRRELPAASSRPLLPSRSGSHAAPSPGRRRP
jgi:hypothetical protein